MNVFNEIVEDCVGEIEFLMGLHPPHFDENKVMVIDPRFTGQLIVAVQKFAWDASEAGRQGLIRPQDFYRSAN